MSSNNSESNQKWNSISIKDLGKIAGGIIFTGAVVSLAKFTWTYYNRETTTKNIDNDTASIDEL